jgi:Leucine-rich repeat (LRR) protein
MTMKNNKRNISLAVLFASVPYFYTPVIYTMDNEVYIHRFSSTYSDKPVENTYRINYPQHKNFTKEEVSLNKTDKDPVVLHANQIPELREEKTDVENLALYGFVDDNIKNINLFTNLCYLDLSNIVHKDYNFTKYISKLDNLKELDISFHSSSNSLKYIQNLPLKILRLSGAKLGGGLTYLKSLTTLETLDLSKTSVDDEMLVDLEDLINLKNLNLTSTQVTHEGVENTKNIISTKRISLGLKKINFEWKL